MTSIASKCKFGTFEYWKEIDAILCTDIGLYGTGPGLVLVFEL